MISKTTTQLKAYPTPGRKKRPRSPNPGRENRHSGSHCHRSYACLAGAKRRGVRCCCLGRQFPAARLSPALYQAGSSGQTRSSYCNHPGSPPARPKSWAWTKPAPSSPESPADITVINLEATAAIGAHELPSSERNTPFLGEEVSGLPMLTLVNGKRGIQDQIAVSNLSILR